MDTVFTRIQSPELFIGIVAPIGTDMNATIDALVKSLNAFGYAVKIIKVTDSFDAIKLAIPSLPELKKDDAYDRYDTYIRFGDEVRSYFNDDAILASIAMTEIAKERNRTFVATDSPSGVCEKVAYIVRQFKRKEETDRLRSVYERLFFQLSVYSNRPNRVDNISKTIASSKLSASPNKFRDLAEKLVALDEDEAGIDHGQKVSEVFHDADAIVNIDLPDLSVEKQIMRIMNLLFGANDISPNKQEYGMYAAKSASLRSLDLPRQVGAAVFTKSGEILALGCNEVPKANGGTYWSDDKYDARDYTRKEDWNQKRKIEILSEVIKVILPDQNLSKIIDNDRLMDTQFMDALEYGRIIHAEMSAICDAARKGVSLQDAVLYCTTFPCHMCAKHIVAAGVKKVVFLERYPKSLANELNGDSLMIEGQYRGDFVNFPSADFLHFYGISPRRYRELFERKKRKDKSGKFREWNAGHPQLAVDIFIPNYLRQETDMLNFLKAALTKVGTDPDCLSSEAASAANTPSTPATQGP